MSVSSSSWGLGRAAVCDCGTPRTFLLLFFGDFNFSKLSWDPDHVPTTRPGCRYISLYRDFQTCLDDFGLVRTKSTKISSLFPKRENRSTKRTEKHNAWLANFTLGPDATLNTEIDKNSVRRKAPNSVNASKRKHKNQINHYNKQRRVLKSDQRVSKYYRKQHQSPHLRLIQTQF